MNKEQKIQKIREILMKYTTPLARYDGFSAWEVATMCYEATLEPDPEKKKETINEMMDAMNDMAKLDFIGGLNE